MPAESMTRHDIYVGGVWTPSDSTDVTYVFNPTSREVIAAVPLGSHVDVDRAVEAARAAFASWSTTTPSERADLFSDIASRMRVYADEFADLISLELGVPISTALAGQVDNSINDIAQMPDVLRGFQWEERVANSLVVRVPRGVVAAITPWNYPLHQITAKFAGAVAAGCTMVVKPSEETPLSAFRFAEVLHEVGLPAGVFNLVSGPGAIVGEALVTHPDVDMVSFTGSTRAGRRISELAAASVKPVSMELGGKSASVVLEGADLQRAVETTLSKTFQNSGQTCTALTRLIVPVARLREVEDIASRATSNYKVGPASDPTALIGPLVNATQRDSVRGYILQGIAEGAKVVAGGAHVAPEHEDGYYVEPTVFSEVTPTMAIAREEIFGPVLSILSYEDEAEAVMLANDSEYGLSGAVWAQDDESALKVARQIRTGMVSINGGPFNPGAPFGGFKQSGHGRELGRFGLDEFLTYSTFQLNVAGT